MNSEVLSGKYLTVKQACEMLGVCRTTLHRLASESGAIVRIGSRNIRIDVEKLSRYLEAE